MSPEQREVTQRLRRRAFRTGDKATARSLLNMATDVEQRRFAQPPRALLRQLRADDPPMPDLDRPAPRAGRPPRRQTIYQAITGSRSLTFELDRRTGDLAVLVNGAEAIQLDEIQARLLRKAFALEDLGIKAEISA